MGWKRDPDIQVRPFAGRREYEEMIDYFLDGSETFLRGMGVDREKLPEREPWLNSVLLDHDRDASQKERAYLAWVHVGALVGHSSISQIKVGEEAFIHLHLWKSGLRKAGLGTRFFMASVTEFMRLFQLERLYSEPFAGNPAPNRVLLKTGFRFIEKYRTIPGHLNFEQDVNRYVLDRSQIEAG